MWWSFVLIIIISFSQPILRISKFIFRYVASVFNNSGVWRKLEGKLVVVIDATSPIGSETCRQLLKRNVDITMVSDNRDSLKNLYNSMGKPDNVDYFVIKNMNDAAFDYTLWSFIDNLNAAMIVIPTYSKVEETSNFVHKKGDRIMNINVKCITHLIHRAAINMKARRLGYILVIGITCERPRPYLSIYSATMAYLKQLVASVYYELKDYNVNVEYIKFGCTSIIDQKQFCVCGCNIRRNVSGMLRKFGTARASFPTCLHMAKTCALSFIWNSLMSNCFTRTPKAKAK